MCERKGSEPGEDMKSKRQKNLKEFNQAGVLRGEKEHRSIKKKIKRTRGCKRAKAAERERKGDSAQLVSSPASPSVFFDINTC